MNKLAAVGILLLAAIFEAAGDAMVRTALHQQPSGLRWLTFLGGAAVLFGYGVIVNTPDWDFGRLLGLYVVFFFIIAQLMSWVLFHQPPSTSTMVGGALIVAGGAVLAIANA
jgi:small multidrug resistance family-3 protein